MKYIDEFRDGAIAIGLYKKMDRRAVTPIATVKMISKKLSVASRVDEGTPVLSVPI